MQNSGSERRLQQSEGDAARQRPARACVGGARRVGPGAGQSADEIGGAEGGGAHAGHPIAAGRAGSGAGDAAGDGGRGGASRGPRRRGLSRDHAHYAGSERGHPHVLRVRPGAQPAGTGGHRRSGAHSGGRGAADRGVRYRVSRHHSGTGAGVPGPLRMAGARHPAVRISRHQPSICVAAGGGDGAVPRGW